MGTCFSKKSDPPLNHPQTLTLIPQTQIPEETQFKKSVFIIKHRNSHEATETPKSSKKPSLDFDNQTLITEKGKEIDKNNEFYEEGSLDDVSLADRISRHRRSRSAGGGGGRRVSRSPSRRSQSPVSSTTSNNNYNNNCNNRPGKMVSVPATVSSVNRISVRRNVGDPVGSSPRGRSPAKRVLSLSRSNSRREEYSPYRRNALGDIDQNCSGNEIQVAYQKTKGENLKTNRAFKQVPYSEPLRSIATEEYEYQMKNEGEGSKFKTANIGLRTDNLKQQIIPRRSPRLSQDQDLNSDIPINPPPPSSYTALLLEDIHNFHQKNNNISASSVSLPSCVSKAQSIVDAVADLNSGTRSNFYATTFDQKNKKSTMPVPFNKTTEKYSCHVSDDVADPTFHNYVTVKRGGTVGIEEEREEEEEEEESSGSNSFVSGNQHWVSSSSWEPNSSDSTEYCTSSKSNNKEENKILNYSKGNGEEKKREPDQQRSGIGRYRVGSARS